MFELKLRINTSFESGSETAPLLWCWRYPGKVWIYSESSEVMHSTSQKHHIKFSQGLIKFTPIRYLDGIDIVIRLSMSMMLKIYMDVLKYYRPDETINFGKKYNDDWRKEFIGIRGVEYKDDKGNTTVI